eukprot:6212596-Pleurochrysis_carterae.AAC.2
MRSGAERRRKTFVHSLAACARMQSKPLLAARRLWLERSCLRSTLSARRPASRTASLCVASAWRVGERFFGGDGASTPRRRRLRSESAPPLLRRASPTPVAIHALATRRGASDSEIERTRQSQKAG